MDEAELRVAVQEAWQAAAVMAMLSLREENLAQAAETNELQLPDHSEDGAALLLHIYKTAPSEDQLLGHACRLAAAGIRADDRRTDLDKRMLYRQMVIAAGFLIGEQELAHKLASTTDEALLFHSDAD